jgi:hypothetical protein
MVARLTQSTEGRAPGRKDAMSAAAFDRKILLRSKQAATADC